MGERGSESGEQAGVATAATAALMMRSRKDEREESATSKCPSRHPTLLFAPFALLSFGKASSRVPRLSKESKR